jgi:hypothetical protein
MAYFRRIISKITTMLNSRKVGIGLYENLGKLFYAVAIADGTVKVKEIDKLKEIIRKSWLDLDAVEDRYHTDEAYQIETVFDWALEYQMTGKQSFEDFADFYMEHRELFSDPIKKLIRETANGIAHSFAGKNKPELVILARLELLLRD